MATAQVDLKILLKALGVKDAEKQLKSLNQTMEQTKEKTKSVSNAQNKNKRVADSLNNANVNSTKGFAKQAQGLGGLVQAYATVAANVFALSSAFLVLRNAADLSSQIKSAINFSDRFGVSVVSLTERVEKASGGALNFADALSSVNKAVSAGVGTEQLEQLTIAATKASQTFGGTTTEALSRFISAAQRGRVDIVQTLGIVIDTEAAYRDYAATINKTTRELSAFDKQQAIINATITESQKVFDGVVIDPNPFQQLLNTVIDLKDVISTFATDALTPLINTFNQSTAAAAGLIALIVSMVGKRIFPSIADEITKFAAAGVASTKAARQAVTTAKQAESKLLLDNEQNVSKLTKQELIRRNSFFRQHYARRLTDLKSFNRNILNENGTLNAKNLQSLRIAARKEINAREGTNSLKPSPKLQDVSTSSLRNQEKIATVLLRQTGELTVSQQKYDAAIANSEKRAQVFIAKTTTGFKKLSAQIKVTSSTLKTGFAQGFAVAQGNAKKALADTGRAYTIFFRDITQGGVTAGKQLLNLEKVIGRSGGLLVGGLTRILSFATTITIAVSLLTLAWDVFGKKLFNVDDGLEKVKQAGEDLASSFKESTDRINKFNSSLNRLPRSSSKFISDLEFLRGTLDTTIVGFRDFEAILSSEFSADNLKDLADNLREVEKNLRSLRSIPDTFESTNTFAGFSTTLNTEGTSRAQEYLNGELEKTRKLFDIIAKDTLPSVVQNMQAVNRILRNNGFEDLTSDVNQSLNEIGLTSEKLSQLKLALRLGSESGILEILSDLDESQAAAVYDAIASSADGAQVKLNQVNTQLQAARTLQEADKSLTNYIGGLEKLRAASAPNKEFLNFLINTTQSFGDLKATVSGANKDFKITKDILESSGVDLKLLRDFLGIEVGDDVSAAYEKSSASLKVFNAVLEDSLVGTLKLKVFSQQIANLKNTEARSDNDRLDNLKELNRLEIESLKLRKSFNVNNLKALQEEQRALIKAEKQGDIVFRQNEQKILVLKNQNAEYTKQQNIIEEGLNVQRESLQIALDNIQAIKTSTELQIQTLKINRKFTTNSLETLSADKKLLRLQRDLLTIEKAKITTKINALAATEANTDEIKRQLLIEQQRLNLITAQTRELELQARTTEARELELTGTTIISEKGAREAARFFVDELQNRARELKGTFEIIGRGFANTINDTFDTAIDNLLAGGKDFGRTVTEALKAGLREAIGEALKARILDGLSLLAAKLLPSFAKEEKKSPVQKNTEALNTLTAAILALAGTSKKEEKLPSVFSGAKKPSKEELRTANTLEGIVQINSESNSLLSSGINGMVAQAELTKILKDEQGQNFATLIETTVTGNNILSELVKAKTTAPESTPQVESVSAPTTAIENPSDVTGPVLQSINQTASQTNDILNSIFNGIIQHSEITKTLKDEQGTNFATLIDSVVNLGSNVVDAINNSINATTTGVTDIVNAISNIQMVPAAQNEAPAVDSKLNETVSKTGSTLDSILRANVRTNELLSTAINSIVGHSEVTKTLKSEQTTSFNTLTTGITNMSNSVVGAINSSIDAMVNGFNNVLNSISVLNNTIVNKSTDSNTDISLESTENNLVNILRANTQTNELIKSVINGITQHSEVTKTLKDEQSSNFNTLINTVATIGNNIVDAVNNSSNNNVTGNNSILNNIVRLTDAVLQKPTEVGSDLSLAKTEGALDSISQGNTQNNALLNSAVNSITVQSEATKSLKTEQNSNFASLNNSILNLGNSILNVINNSISNDNINSSNILRGLTQLTGSLDKKSSESGSATDATSKSLDRNKGSLDGIAQLTTKGNELISSVVNEIVLQSEVLKGTKDEQNNNFTTLFGNLTKVSNEIITTMRTLSAVPGNEEDKKSSVGIAPEQSTTANSNIESLYAAMQQTAAEKKQILTQTNEILRSVLEVLNIQLETTIGFKEEQNLNFTNLITSIKTGNTESLSALSGSAGTAANNGKKLGELPNVFKEQTPEQPSLSGTEGALENITEANKEGNNLLSTVADTLFGQTDLTEIFKNEQNQNFGSLIASIFTTTASLIGTIIASNTASAAQGGFGFFAKGGIIPGGTGVVQKFATGGMITEPTAAIMGEGSRNEAVVPLPNNREIPVDLRGTSGDTINIEQNFDFTNADSDSVSKLRTEARAIEERTFNRVFSEINKGGTFAKISGRR